MENNVLSIANLKLEYAQVDTPKVILECFSANFKKGEIVSVFGVNGCGKSSLLNHIAGFKNKILFSSCKVDTTRLKIGYIIQNSSLSLFDWVSPLENIIFPIEYNKSTSVKSELIKGKKVCESFGFNFDWNILTRDLSGGQKQKLAIIRELYKEPDLLLIDEGFVAIDYRLRIKTILKLREWVKDNNTTIINISHHIEEAVLFSDRILILDNKKIEEEHIINLKEPRKKTIKSSNSDFGLYVQKIKKLYL